MSYPGNQSLPADVQQRIRSTFEHTLTLASSGSRQEAILGCEFVLRMDPNFDPARRLQERLAASAGPEGVGPLKQKKPPLPLHPLEFSPPGWKANPGRADALEKLAGVVKAKSLTPNRPPSVSVAPLIPVMWRLKVAVVVFRPAIACRS